ncbi:DUF4214 domain-containing protein [Massilia sp. ST3]|uniref:DUF4214 domain-containing protein n=1 Tax=Massilia sp. ST3 TaxID=2824903 RepID=UPI001B8209A9|nr:DUF4214 domain-containing protein [Massilia sp. ST3]MBQ5947796.1 DUF4214 domain-containing protein [Massilia sp. ST3]
MSTQSTLESTVNSLYLAFYGRPADPAGIKFWAEQLSKADGNIDAIKASFANSEEARVRFGNDTAADRITEIYQQLFNRDPDAKGLEFWVDAVSKGHASVADVAISVLKGAQGSDQALTSLRQKAADSFTAEVAATGSGYGGIAAVEAARVLVRAVTADATASDIDALVEASAELADVVTDNPEVMDALGSGDELLELFEGEEGSDPVALVETLAETARGASADAHALASLMKGGGMSNLLKVLPEGMTLKDVKAAMGKGGLPAALKKMFPDGVPANPGKPGKPGKPTDPDSEDGMSLGFHLADTPSKLTLTAESAVTGLDNADGLALKDYGSGAAQATAVDYTGAGLALEGTTLSFDGALAAGLYQMSWQADTFSTADSHLAAGSVLFAGGQDGLFVQEGFSVAKTTAVSGDLARAATEQVNEAFIGGATAASIATGGGHDVVADHGGALSIVVDRFDSTAADLILGFDSGDDSIELTGAAATAIDANADGQIQWGAAGEVGAMTEGVSVTVDAQLVMGGTAVSAATLAALNGKLDVSALALNADLLILAKADTGAALFQYVNKDDDDQIDADELTQVAMFADGAPGQDDIVLVAQAAPAP